MIDDDIKKINKKITDILNSYDDLDSSQIGLIITWSIEYLINERNYDFEKMMKTIRRCHEKILNFKDEQCN